MSPELENLFQLIKSNADDKDFKAAVKIVKQQEQSVDGFNDDGETPLFYACTFARAQHVKILLKAGANPLIASGKHRSLPIHIAASRGYENILTSLCQSVDDIKRFIMVNTRSADGKTSLISAAIFNRSKTAIYLLDNYAVSQFKDGDDQNALDYFTSRNNTPMINLLCAHGAKPTPEHMRNNFLTNKLVNQPNYSYQIFKSSGRFGALNKLFSMIRDDSDIDLFRKEISQNLDLINIHNKRLETLIYAAVVRQRHAHAEILLKQGANQTFLSTKRCILPIFRAIKNKDLRMVKLLLNHCDQATKLAMVNYVMPGPLTPLKYARHLGSQEIAQELVANGAINQAQNQLESQRMPGVALRP